MQQCAGGSFFSGVAVHIIVQAERAWLQAQDPANEASAKLLVSLLQLGPAFAQVHPEDATKAANVLSERQGLQDQLDQLTMSSAQLLAKQRDALDDSNKALFDQVQGLKSRADAIQAVKDSASTLLGDVDNAFTVLQNVTKVMTDALTQRINAEQALLDAVKSTLSSMKTSTTTLTDRTAAQAQIRAAAAAVKAGGDLPTADSLKDAFSVVSKDASSQFSTYQDTEGSVFNAERPVRPTSRDLVGGQIPPTRRVTSATTTDLLLGVLPLDL